MPGITIAVLNDKELACKIGKKGTTSDIQMYNYTTCGKHLTLAYPEKYPEKLQSLLYVLDMCDTVLIVVNELSSFLGEEIVTIQRFADSSGFVILDNYIQEENWKKVASGTVLANYKIVEKNVPSLLETFSHLEPVSKFGFPCIPIDHYFNVKGVGTVILGVARGTVRKHDKLRVYPTEKVVEVRSIHVHDVDVEEAVNGERVGLALKGIDADELERGFVLAPEDTLDVRNQLRIEGEIERYYRGNLEPGSVVHIYLRMGIFPAKITEISREGQNFSGELELQKPVGVAKTDKILVVDLNAKGLRVVGAGKPIL
ncbi:MAG: EF-Tu/IF-2/RF-3 family GTPase [Thermoplasmata archaeon]